MVLFHNLTPVVQYSFCINIIPADATEAIMTNVHATVDESIFSDPLTDCKTALQGLHKHVS